MSSLVLIPSFNERESVLQSIIRQIRTLTSSSILIVDDGSENPCNTNALDVDYILRHQKNKGYGKSLIDGFNFAIRNDFCAVVTIDGDGQHDPTLIPTFLNALNRCNIVNGTRHSDASKILTPLPEKWGWDNKIITDLLNSHFDLGITDSTCGYRAYTISSLERLKPTIYGYGIAVQILAKAGILGLVIREVPIPVMYFSTRRKFKGIMSTREGALRYHRSIIARELRKGAMPG